MSILRTIRCNVEGCEHTATESVANAGWPGWGRVQGKVDTETGETDFDLCPKHLDAVFNSILSMEA